jgi:type IV secretory pathway ATPase VirB11/archaellum biosynthesis ATPase
MKHKKAKLLRRLVRGGADDAVVSDNVGSEKTISLSEVMDIFEPDLEDLTDELVDELRADGMRVERLEEMRQMGLKYNRSRRSFTSGEIVSF